MLGVALCVVVLGDLARANRDALYAPRPEVILDPPASARAILADAAARGNPGDTAPRVFSNPRGRPLPRSLPAAVALDRSLPWGAVGELYGLANVNAPSSLNLVKHEWLQEALGGVPRPTAVAALAALGTRYVTSWLRLDEVPDAVAIPIPGERIGVKLYALADAQPRAFVARRVREARDGRSALERFVAGDGGSARGPRAGRAGSSPGGRAADRRRRRATTRPRRRASCSTERTGSRSRSRCGRPGCWSSTTPCSPAGAPGSTTRPRRCSR